MDKEYEREEELKERQDGRTFRLGRVLRGTFPDRDEVLEPAMTRLMLQLTHLPYGQEDATRARPVAASPPGQAAAQPSLPGRNASLLRRIASRLHLA